MERRPSGQRMVILQLQLCMKLCSSTLAATEVSDGGGKGIITAIFQTNSTDTLAPLNGMIAAGIDDMMPGGGSHITFWKWESGIGNTTTGLASLMQE